MVGVVIAALGFTLAAVTPTGSVVARIAANVGIAAVGILFIAVFRFVHARFIRRADHRERPG